jgi:hypothetical protein
MTPDAAGLFVGDSRVLTFNRTHDVLMTLSTSRFGHLAAARRDVDVVFEPTSREVIGMPKAIPRFGGVFTDETGRRVAIVANGYVSMAGL